MELNKIIHSVFVVFACWLRPPDPDLGALPHCWAGGGHLSWSFLNFIQTLHLAVWALPYIHVLSWLHHWLSALITCFAHTPPPPPPPPPKTQPGYRPGSTKAKLKPVMYLGMFCFLMSPYDLDELCEWVRN